MKFFIFIFLIGLVLLAISGRNASRKRKRGGFASPTRFDRSRSSVRRMDDFRPVDRKRLGRIPEPTRDIEYYRSNDIGSKVADYGSAKFALKNQSLLTEREQGCYWRLVTALGPDFIVMGQVAFSQILTVKGGSGDQNFALYQTMKQKVADFVICRKDLSMVAVVELDDSSHTNKRDKDKIRDRAIKEAGLLVFRLPSTPNHEPVERLADVLKRLDQLQTV